MINIIIYAGESWLLILFALKVLRNRYNSFLIFQFMLLLQLLKMSFDIIGIFGTILYFIVDLITIHLCYSGIIEKKLFVVILYYACLALSDMTAFLFVIYIYELLSVSSTNIGSFYYLLSFISKALTLFIIHIFGKVSKTEDSLREWMVFLPLPAITVVTLTWIFPYFFNYDTDIVPMVFLICLFALSSNIISYGLILKSAEEKRLHYRLEINEEFKKLQENYYHEMQTSYCRLEKAAHDINLHLNYLEAAPDYKTMKDYLKSLRKKEFLRIIQYTGNIDIDIILSTKHQIMQEKGIKLNINNVRLPAHIAWLDSVDLSIILGNALNNAIDACGCCHGDNICISFQYHNWFIFSMENPTDSKPLPKKYGAGFMSSKKGERHGIGMENMEAAVARYDGHIEYTVDEGIFRLDVLLQSLGEPMRL